jgi:hypothetical protein
MNLLQRQLVIGAVYGFILGALLCLFVFCLVMAVKGGAR